MSKPAFLVDGFTEKYILQKICPNSVIRHINCNGENVSITAIAARISTIIRTLNNVYHPIFILVDREDRVMTCEQISSELFIEIRRAGINDNLIIGVCDRMIENWILADFENFKQHVSLSELPKLETSEGIRAKQYIKKIFRGYSETTDGVKWFLSADYNVMFDTSASFRQFITLAYGNDCVWADLIWQKSNINKHI